MAKEFEAMTGVNYRNMFDSPDHPTICAYVLESNGERTRERYLTPEEVAEMEEK